MSESLAALYLDTSRCWMRARRVGLTLEEEGHWAETLEILWEKLDAEEQAEVERELRRASGLYP